VRARAERLEKLQSRRERLERNYLRERMQLEAKYEGLYSPLYEQRSEVLAEKGDGEEVGVPCFWLTALMRCDAVREGMNEKDPDVLRYLTDLRVERFGPAPKPAKPVEEVLKQEEDSEEEEEEEEEEEAAGFRLRFAFDAASNPYFTNAELVKTYWVEDEGVSFSVAGDLYSVVDGTWRETERSLLRARILPPRPFTHAPQPTPPRLPTHPHTPANSTANPCSRSLRAPRSTGKRGRTSPSR
jgi:hypothetical protein